VVVALEPTGGEPGTTAALTPPTLQDEVVRVLSQRPDVDLLRSQLIRSSCTDRCAATVTLLQHFGYQVPSFFDSLLPLCSCDRRQSSSAFKTTAIEPGQSQQNRRRKKEKKKHKAEP
jgi:hypothetical protein